MLRHVFGLEDTVALLGRTPGALDVLLRDAPATLTLRNEGEGTWTVRDVIAHLVYGERTDWLPRTRMILQCGDSRPFEPFDREASVRQDGATNELLDEFARVRAANLDELRAMHVSVDDLQRRGLHPALGAVTLGQLLASWAAHDLTHLHQIARVMAHQLREAAGPWRAYMGVMQCGAAKHAP